MKPSELLKKINSPDEIKTGLVITDKLKEHIANNDWAHDMNSLIGEFYDINLIYHFGNGYNLHSGWFIPGDSAVAVTNEPITVGCKAAITQPNPFAGNIGTIISIDGDYANVKVNVAIIRIKAAHLMRIKT